MCDEFFFLLSFISDLQVKAKITLYHKSALPPFWSRGPSRFPEILFSIAFQKNILPGNLPQKWDIEDTKSEPSTTLASSLCSSKRQMPAPSNRQPGKEQCSYSVESSQDPGKMLLLKITRLYCVLAKWMLLLTLSSSMFNPVNPQSTGPTSLSHMSSPAEIIPSKKLPDSLQ